MPEISINMSVINQYQPQVGLTGVMLYIRLSSLVDDKREVTIAARKLAEMMGVSTDTIRRATAKMERAGMLAIRQNLDELGRLMPYTYTLLV